MKINIINPDNIISKYKFPEIVSPIIATKTGEFNPGGLFSPNIFGEPGSELWKEQFAYIDLHVYAYHPFAYDIAKRHFSVIISIMNREKGLVFDTTNSNLLLSITKKSDVTGFTVLYKYYDQIISFLKKEKPQHLKLLNKISNKQQVFVSKWLVIPPLYRPASTDIITSEVSYHPINDVYVSILKLAQRAEISSSLIGSDSSSLMITKQLYELFTIESDLIKGKTGLFRGNILGRRVDFSTRSVIVADPKIHPNEIGIPKSHALKMFLPFVMYHIKSNPDIYSKIISYEGISSVSELLTTIQKFVDGKLKISDATIDILYNKVLPLAIKDKVVVYKRDPVLHRTSIMAGYVKLVDDSAIHLAVTNVGPLNADYDGDTLRGIIAINISVPVSEGDLANSKKYDIISLKEEITRLKGVKI